MKEHEEKVPAFLQHSFLVCSGSERFLPILDDPKK